MTEQDILKEKLTKSYGWDWQNLQELAISLGYEYIRQSGSHKVYHHPMMKKNLIIPANKDLRRTDCSIIKDLREVYKLKYNEKVEEEVVVEKEKQWFEFVKDTRIKNNYGIDNISNQIGMAFETYKKIENGERQFSIKELSLWCALMNENHEELSKKFPLRKVGRPKKINTIVKDEERNYSSIPKEEVPAFVKRLEEVHKAPVIIKSNDLTTAGEIMMERFKELDELMKRAEELKPEYEKLKEWLEFAQKFIEG